ncbi:MAG: hypothetical protein PVG53_06090, partial [Holophagae bacterium]|jgi:SSS family solute:Na+ symporter
MVSGLLVPVIGALFWSRATPSGAMVAMILGGGTTVALELLTSELPLGLDGNVFGIAVSAVVFVAVSLLTSRRDDAARPTGSPPAA